MALEQFDLSGQVAIVTGGGRGCGRGIAGALAEAGAAVVVSARNETELAETVSLIEQAGGKALYVTGDVTSRADNERVVAAAVERFGRVDILVNNAGGGGYAPFLEITDQMFRDEYDLNVTSAFMLSQLTVPHMIRQGTGSIVNISSACGRMGVRGLASYCAAKGGLNQLTRAMAQELAPKVRVNALAIGYYDTSAFRLGLMQSPDAAERLMKHIPIHRIGQVDDLGRLCVYLSTRDCNFTSAVLEVDGGIQGPSGNAVLPDL